MKLKLLSASVFFLLFLFNLKAQMPGDLDLSFGNNGIQLVPLGTANAFGRSLAIQPDGKLVAACIANNENTDFALVRLTSSGDPDTSFGTNGMVMTDFALRSDIAKAIAIDGLDRIVVAGYTDNGNGFDFAVARYLPNGILDSTFHHDGMVSEPLGITSFCQAIVIQADNKIVIGGYFLSPFSQTNEFGLMRFEENGTLDETFSNDGIVTTHVLHPGAGVGNALALQPDGKIILAGQVFNETTLLWEIGMVRYMNNGVLDSSFGQIGISIFAMPGGNFTITSVDLQDDKKIIVGGFFGTAPSNNRFAVARFHEDGKPDTEFGDNGVVLDSYGAEDNQITTLVIQPDGYILVAGTSLSGNADRFAIARLTPDGEFDVTFGNEGIVIDVIGQNDGISTMALQQDGKLVVAGESFNGTNFSVAFARYETGLLSAVEEPFINETGLSVYPNPAHNFVHLLYELKKPTSIQYILTDIAGKKLNLTSSSLIKNSGMHNEMIHLPIDLMTGMYWLSLQTPRSVETIKLMVTE